MKRRVVFINVLILAGVLILAARLRSSWAAFEQDNDLERIFDGTQQESLSPSGVEPMSQPGSFPQFVVIAEKTLFAEDRRPWSEEEVVAVEVEEPAVVVEEPPKWATRPMLHGVSAVRGKRQGIMTVFEDKTGELRKVQVGDLVQGYWVDEIGTKTMRLRWGDRDEIIDMADARKPAGAEQPTPGEVTVITVGSAPSAVQKTTAREANQQQGSGLEVSVVGAGSGQAGAGLAGGAQQSQGNRVAQPARQGVLPPATNSNPGSIP